MGTEIIYPQLLYYFEDSKEESKAAKAAGPVRSFKPPCYSRVDSHARYSVSESFDTRRGWKP
jgi:hypothetical protein